MCDFLCRRCRHVLFNEDHLGSHKSHVHSIPRRKQHGVKGNRVQVLECSSYFLRDDTDLDWLNNLSEVEGKLSCPNPKCGVRLGSYNWSGTQCSCGTWVVPAIQVPMSKVDRREVQPAVIGLKDEAVDDDQGLSYQDEVVSVEEGEEREGLIESDMGATTREVVMTGTN